MSHFRQVHRHDRLTPRLRILKTEVHLPKSRRCISPIPPNSSLGKSGLNGLPEFTWSTSAMTRAIKHPKVFLRDAGLTAHLLGVTPASLATGGPHEARAGTVLETFVAGELAKQAAWSVAAPNLSHFRDQAGREVDVIAHTRDGLAVGVEVKAAASVTARDFRSLAHLRDVLGEDFRAGIVLYAGERTVLFGPRLAAVPINALWSPTPEILAPTITP
jgi:predicted AAA+ superfamily ATPase